MLGGLRSKILVDHVPCYVSSHVIQLPNECIGAGLNGIERLWWVHPLALHGDQE